jgi:hypothetical protein
MLNHRFVRLDIFTITADAILVTDFTVCKAFTVHFETEGFFAGTADTFFLS